MGVGGLYLQLLAIVLLLLCSSLINLKFLCSMIGLPPETLIQSSSSYSIIPSKQGFADFFANTTSVLYRTVSIGYLYVLYCYVLEARVIHVVRGKPVAVSPFVRTVQYLRKSSHSTVKIISVPYSMTLQHSSNRLVDEINGGERVGPLSSS